MAGRQKQIALSVAALVVAVCFYFQGFYAGALVNNSNVGVFLTASGFGLGVTVAMIIVLCTR